MEICNPACLIIARYDRNASRYHKGVYTRKRADLVGVLDSTLSTLFLGQLKNLHKLCLVAFKQELLNGLRGETYDFADVVSKARERCEGTFSEGAKEALVEDTDWTWADELESLKEEVRSIADQCRKDETKKMLNLIEVIAFLSSGTRTVSSSDLRTSEISRNIYRNLWNWL